jgi:RNA polymerase sigma factor (sigma-70 family)
VAITEQESAVFRAIGNNEKDAIEAVYKENYSLIQHFVVSNNGSEDDARDIFQEAMMVLYEKSRQPEFELTCQIRTYLYSVCRRLWLKKLQYNRRIESQVENFDKIVPVEEDIEDHDKLNGQYLIMRTAMGKIGEPCKSLIEAFYVHRKTCRKLQVISDIPMQTMQRTRNTNVWYGLKSYSLPNIKVLKNNLKNGSVRSVAVGRIG